MTLACTICKRFISAADALCCDRNPKHVFHEECACGQLDPASESFDASTLACPTCRAQAILGGLSNARGPVSEVTSATPAAQLDSIKDLITAVLVRVDGIEHRLDDLPTLREQLQDLPTMKAQLTSLERSVQRSLGTIAAKTEELASSLQRVDAKQSSLDARVRTLEARPSSGLGASAGDLEERLETLERDRLSSELILFGVRELPSEDTRAVVTSIASVLGVAVPPGEILSCVRIPSRGDRPRPIIVRLSSSDARNRWINGKRTKGILEGAEVSASLSGSRIDLNERLLASVRAILGEARLAVREGRLNRAWVRNGIVYITRHLDTSPIRVRHREHLDGLIASPSPPPSSCRIGHWNFQYCFFVSGCAPAPCRACSSPSA